MPTVAKIKKVGQALVLTSAITSKEYDKIVKFEPKALELKTEKGELTFKVQASCDASLSKYGVGFDALDKDEHLQLTMMTNAGSKEEIMDSYAGILANLTKVEAQVAEAGERVNDLFASVEGSIEVE